MCSIRFYKHSFFIIYPKNFNYLFPILSTAFIFVSIFLIFFSLLRCAVWVIFSFLLLNHISVTSSLFYCEGIVQYSLSYRTDIIAYCFNIFFFTSNKIWRKNSTDFIVVYKILTRWLPTQMQYGGHEGLLLYFIFKNFVKEYVRYHGKFLYC